MRTAYGPMRDRAALFGETANLMFVVVALAALWFGFEILFSIGFVIWSALPHVLDNPSLVDALFIGSTPAAVGYNLAFFGIYTAILVVLMRGLHGLRLPALIGPLPTALRDFIRVSLYLSPLYLIVIVPSLLAPEAVQQYSFGKWLALLPLILPLLFIQISAEELVFRGYLQSHLAALTSNPIIWIAIPSFLFGLIHYDPTAPSYTAWLYVLWAATLGAVCADLTARTGNMGAALAVHFINNIGALVILAADDWLFGAALFVWPMNGEPWDPWLLYEALFLLTVWLCARLALRR